MELTFLFFFFLWPLAQKEKCATAKKEIIFFWILSTLAYPATHAIAAGTVPVRCFLFTGTVPADNLFH